MMHEIFLLCCWCYLCNVGIIGGAGSAGFGIISYVLDVIFNCWSCWCWNYWLCFGSSFMFFDPGVIGVCGLSCWLNRNH